MVHATVSAIRCSRGSTSRYHEGIERGRIFRDDQDRENFLERLAVLLTETKTACYAWVLLGNHAHFLLRTGMVGISTLMRRLLTGYAVTCAVRRGEIIARENTYDLLN